MAWGIILKEVPVLRVDRNNLKGELADAEDYLDSLRDDIKVLAFGTPHSVEDMEGNTMQWEDWAPTRLRSLLEDYESTVWLKSRLEYAVDNPDDVTEY
jgi:hypothetical protein